MRNAGPSSTEKAALGKAPARYFAGPLGKHPARDLVVIAGLLVVVAGIVLRLDLVKPQIGTTGQFREIRLVHASGNVPVIRDDGLHANWRSGEPVRIVGKASLANWVVERISDGRTAQVSEHVIVGTMECRNCRAEMQVLASAWGNPVRCPSCREETVASLPKP